MDIQWWWSAVLLPLLPTLRPAYRWAGRVIRERAEVRRALRELPTTVGQFKQIADNVSEITKQVRPNGGGSLADAITRNEAKLNGLIHNVRVLGEKVDANDLFAYFECDVNGRNIDVSETYCRWLNCSEGELLGMDFLNFIPEGEQPGVIAHWDACRASGRVYQHRHNIVPRGGHPILVDVRCKPIPPGGAPVSWVGVVKRV